MLLRRATLVDSSSTHKPREPSILLYFPAQLIGVRVLFTKRINNQTLWKLIMIVIIIIFLLILPRRKIYIVHVVLRQ